MLSPSEAVWGVYMGLLYEAFPSKDTHFWIREMMKSHLAKITAIPRLKIIRAQERGLQHEDLSG